MSYAFEVKLSCQTSIRKTCKENPVLKAPNEVINSRTLEILEMD